MVRGRRPVYDWDDKYDICYKLYVDEGKEFLEIIRYFAERFNVPESELPSRQTFIRQFAKWGFPPHRPKLNTDVASLAVSRMRELWEQNLPIKTIRETLEEEGFQIRPNDFRRLRRENGLMGKVVTTPIRRKRKRQEGEDGAAGYSLNELATLSAPDVSHAREREQSPGPSADEIARREQRMVQLLIESDEKGLARKRRRRIRGYGTLPKDAPNAPPRYNSETTLDECKAFLLLSNEMYITMRAEFDAICREMGIERKKTNLENGLWQAAKDRLVIQNMHLSAVMHPLQPNLEQKANAIDVICADVTKRIRDESKKLTMADANNTLGLNPTASKELRRAFYQILERDHYSTRLACGEEHWKELQQTWYDSSPLLQSVITEGDPYKLRCVYILCRDATKRYNDDRVRKDPSKRQFEWSAYGPGPGPVKANGGKKKAIGKKATESHAESSRAPVAAEIIDPALSAPEPLAIPAYFRLSPQSKLVGNHPRMWLSKLTARTVDAVRQAGTGKAGAATITKIQGIIKNDDGTEDNYQIDSDDELDVYLEAAGEKSTFLVVLEGGYA